MALVLAYSTAVAVFSAPQAQASVIEINTATTKFVGPSGSSFGWSLALDGDTLAIGAPNDSQAGSDAGAVFVYRFNGTSWEFSGKLMAADAQAGDRFGLDVDLEGDDLVVGTWKEPVSAYVFTRVAGVWVEQATLTPADNPARGSFVDARVVFSQGKVLVGAPSRDPAAVYVFSYNGTNWVEEATLTASDAGTGFAAAVALDGSTAVVGAKESIYMYTWDGSNWPETALLTDPDGVGCGVLGRSVDVDAGTMVAGESDCMLHEGAGTVGWVHVLAWSGSDWVVQSRLPDANEGPDGFGTEVSLNGDHLVVGAPDGLGEVGRPGAVYLYERTGDTWTEILRLGGEIDDDRFGETVSLDGDNLAVGAPFVSTTGAVYVFHLPDVGAPVAEDIGIAGDEDEQLGWVPSVSDPNGDSLECSIDIPPVNGEATVSPDCTAGIYTPDPDFNGADGFEYQVSDGLLADTGMVSVTVDPVNDSPIADDLPISVNEDESIVWIPQVEDVDGDTLSCMMSSPATHGEATINMNCALGDYTPNLEYNGSDSFEYEVSDGVLTDTANVTVTVHAVNDPPSADAGPNLSGEVGEAIVLDGTGSSDPDGDPLKFSWSVVSRPTGSLTDLLDSQTAKPRFRGDTAGTYLIRLRVSDGGFDDVDEVSVSLEDAVPPPAVKFGDGSVGVVDTTTGVWNLRDASNGATTSFFYGNPGDYPIVGDWDCDGDETPGLYRQSDGFVYLRNSNTQGVADIRFFFGNPGDIPTAGDFNSNGCDTVSIYRPSEGRTYIINELGQDGGGLGAADFAYYFGNPGDKPFVGDFDDDGVDELGLHRESTGLVYFRYTHTEGIADESFIYGNPSDKIIAADWAQSAAGPETVGIFRPLEGKFYLNFENAAGFADVEFAYGNSNMLPVAGDFGALLGEKQASQ